MTWLTTWPVAGIPKFAEHDTEALAEAHAAEIVRSGESRIATAFWSEDSIETLEGAA